MYRDTPKKFGGTAGADTYHRSYQAFGIHRKHKQTADASGGPSIGYQYWAEYDGNDAAIMMQL